MRAYLLNHGAIDFHCTCRWFHVVCWISYLNQTGCCCCCRSHSCQQWQFDCFWFNHIFFSAVDFHKKKTTIACLLRARFFFVVLHKPIFAWKKALIACSFPLRGTRFIDNWFGVSCCRCCVRFFSRSFVALRKQIVGFLGLLLLITALLWQTMSRTLDEEDAEMTSGETEEEEEWNWMKNHCHFPGNSLCQSITPSLTSQ